jgi:uncharacterized protein (TIRG00374 family)
MKPKQKKHFRWRQGLLLATLVVATYVLVPQLGQFHASFSAIKEANFALLGLAFAAILSAALLAALSYDQLSFRRIPFHRIALIQYAGMFINRLLPAGIGGVSLFIDFLYRQGHSLPKASTIAAINNGLGFAGHLTLLLVAGVATGFTAMPDVSFENIEWYVLACGLAILLLWLIFRYAQKTGRIAQFMQNIFKTVGQFKTRKLALIRAYLCCILNTSLHILALTLVIRAFGVDLPLVASLVILTGGVAAATVTPTPGGVIGAEAALTAVLITYDVNSSTALAIALSYRFVSYWLPILPGVVAFWIVQKRRYI